MTRSSQRLHERLPAQAENIGRLRHAVVNFARRNGATDRQLDDVALAVSEALSNALMHAYVGRNRPGVMEVHASVDQGSLMVVVCDEGVGLMPRLDSPGLGCGLAIISRVTEKLDLVDARPGVRVIMTFSLTQSWPEGSAAI